MNLRDSAMSLHSAPSSSASSSCSSARSNTSLLTSSSWRSLKSRCIRTGEFCAAGHELVRIPVVDRKRYLQQKEMLLQKQENRQPHQQYYRHPYDAPTTVDSCTIAGPSPNPVVIECDCCSRVLSKELYIDGCCLECDIDVCGNCFKNGQSYIDVVLKESRESDMHDERHQQQQQQNCGHHERYNRRRPTYVGTGRVNYDDYPDPTVFQWSFTGSSSEDNSSAAPVEYFEKDFGKEVGVIRLDFYYTIGTVQTTIVDSIRGTIHELFTKSRQKMSPQSYRKILKDPRTYNNEKYKKGRQANHDDFDYWRRKRQQVL